jgi:hypothetical protein
MYLSVVGGTLTYISGRVPARRSTVAGRWPSVTVGRGRGSHGPTRGNSLTTARYRDGTDDLDGAPSPG